MRREYRTSLKWSGLRGMSTSQTRRHKCRSPARWLLENCTAPVCQPVIRHRSVQITATSCSLSLSSARHLFSSVMGDASVTPSSAFRCRGLTRLMTKRTRALSQNVRKNNSSCHKRPDRNGSTGLCKWEMPIRVRVTSESGRRRIRDNVFPVKILHFKPRRYTINPA